MTTSTESAMTSRDTSEKCMPSWPIEMPSETEMVPNSNGKPPASNTPSRTALASRLSDRLQGVISFQDDATPTCDLTQSSSPMPTARSMPARRGLLYAVGDVAAARLVVDGGRLVGHGRSLQVDRAAPCYDLPFICRTQFRGCPGRWANSAGGP